MIPDQPITLDVAEDTAETMVSGGACAARVATGQSILIVNADDWGRDRETTDLTRDCVMSGSVSSVSAMVFMQDSERACALAKEHGIDAGLHLNLTIPFSGARCPSGLVEHQRRIASFFCTSRFAPAMYHPGLASSFRYVVQSQLEEYARLYQRGPQRIDGHHHMHLAANVLGQKLLPAGTILRPNFSFSTGEKSFLNRLYRRGQNRLLARRHRLADFFFDILPLDAERLKRIAALGREYNVEIETHPADREQYDFLMRGELAAMDGVEIARGYQLRDPGFLMPVAPRTLGSKAGTRSKPHICVCICTYKRPRQLRRLLDSLNRQETGGLFSLSIVVVDNDETRSAETTIRKAQATSAVPIKYCSEPARGIPRARNKAVANAEGDFIAMIDDDEFPGPGWLLKLFGTFESYNADGVLGPVRRHFDEEPPAWLRKSPLGDRRINPTGMRVDWHEARTGNVLVKRSLFASDPAPFRPEFRTGEDQDFFRRKIAEGRAFIWSCDAEVFESVPPSRWTRRYYLRRAIFNGAHSALQPTHGAIHVLKSVIAIPMYTLLLPAALIGGQHHFMTLLEKLCNHAGQLLFKLRLNPFREEYLSD